jgi:Undecaprenyl-phosphate glucose phosphotransferase
VSGPSESFSGQLRGSVVLKQRHQFFVGLLSLVDAVVATGACLIAWLLRRWFFDAGWPAFASLHDAWELAREALLHLELPIAFACLWAFGLYRPRRDRALMVESFQMLKAALTSVVLLIVVLWVLGPRFVATWLTLDIRAYGDWIIDAPRLQLAGLTLLLPLLLTAHRIAFRLAVRALRRRGWNLRHVVVVGTGRLGRIACRTLDRNSWTGLHVIGFIHHGEHPPASGMCLGRPVLGGLADLERVMESHEPDAVYLATPAARSTVMPSLLRRLERFAVDVRIIPDVHPRYMPQSMTVSDLEGMPVLSVRESPLHGYSGILKRTVDVVGASIAILIFSPLMLLIALFVRAGSRGPVIFRQRRVSLGGEVFEIYKFRTMRHADMERDQASQAVQASEHGEGSARREGETGWTRRDDPRITPIGGLLRRTSLDELPQLFNVLLGDMSLVGPRPERPELIERFRDDWRGYMLRQHVKAGITGWAQVNGLRGDTSLRKRLQHDLFYIRHWSLGFDFKILWLTLFRGFIHRNAH